MDRSVFHPRGYEDRDVVSWFQQQVNVSAKKCVMTNVCQPPHVEAFEGAAEWPTMSNWREGRVESSRGLRGDVARAGAGGTCVGIVATARRWAGGFGVYGRAKDEDGTRFSASRRADVKSKNQRRERIGKQQDGTRGEGTKEYGTSGRG